MRIVYWFVLLVALVNIVLSAAIYAKSSVPASNMCSAHCDVVLGSSYSKLFGIPQALIGVFSFTVLALLVWYCLVFETGLSKKLVLIALVLGSLYALRMLYIQAFILNAFCPYCVVIDTSMIVAGLAVLFMHKRRKAYVPTPQTSSF